LIGLEICMFEHLWVMGLLFVFGFVTTVLIVPVFKGLAHTFGFVSTPGIRKTHTQPTPMLGGITIFVPFCLIFTCFFVLSLTDRLSPYHADKLQMLSLFLGSTWIMLLGTLDDRVPLGWRKKLLGQIVGTLILVLGGHTIATATLPLFGPVDFGLLGIPLFMIAVIAITNAINLIDGIDGLAGGICFFAALTSGIIGLSNGDLFPATISFTISGSLLGFLMYNFPPASMFLGDGGSMLIGFLLGTLAMSAQAIAPGQRLGTSVMILVPFLPFGIPLFEVGLSIVRRWFRGQAVFLGDGDHLHYRVRDKTENPRLTVAIFYLFSATFCALTLFLVLRLESEIVRFLIVIASIVLFGGVIASIGLYRVANFSTTLRNRRHFRYLGSYLSSMRRKIEKAQSIDDLIDLLESGVSDLNFDTVEVFYDGRTVKKWSNPRKVHPYATRTDSEASLGGGRLSVKWQRPIHHEEPYNEYLRMTWSRFLATLGDDPAVRAGDPTASEEANLSSTIKNVPRGPFS